jgi:hypothetical protein
MVVARMGHMSGFAEPWGPGFDPAHGILALPLWSVAVSVALFAAYCVFVLARAGRDGVGRAFSRAGLLLVGGAVAWAVLDAISAGTFADQRRALDARLLEMNTRALMPGSPLACLDATAGELVEASCEKALFASPEAVAASVAYVSAQLSLLADGSEYERRSGANYESALGGLRHAIETDRFGIVAHVLADRDGCTAERCGGFGLLRDTSQVSENLSEHKYDSTVLHHASEWLQSALSMVASNTPASTPPVLPPATAPNAAAVASAALPLPKTAPNGLFFPSSASIPPVSIMSAEPTGPSPQADAAAKPPSAGARKPASATQQARRPANAASPANPVSLARPAPDQASDQ